MHQEGEAALSEASGSDLQREAQLQQDAEETRDEVLQVDGTDMDYGDNSSFSEHAPDGGDVADFPMAEEAAADWTPDAALTPPAAAAAILPGTIDFCNITVVAHNDAEVHCLVPVHSSSYHSSKRWYEFVTLRRVMFADGVRVAGWCMNTCEAPSTAMARQWFPMQHYTDELASEYAEALQLCPHAAYALRKVGGPQQLESLLTTTQLRPLPRRVTVAGREVWVVELPADGTEGSRFAAVEHRSGPDGASLYCTACPNNHRHCNHCSVLLRGKPDKVASRRLASAATAEEKLRKVFDFATGQRKLQCLSKLHIPDRLKGDEPLARELRAIVAGEHVDVGCTVLQR